MQALKILFSLLMFFSFGQTSEMPRETVMPVEPIAQCLTEQGVKLYGAFWCPHCADQKEIFGDAFEHITYIECDPKGENADPQACTDAEVTAYPTWIFADGERLVGNHDIEILAETAGC